MNCHSCSQVLTPTQLLATLSPREREAADLIMIGKSNKEIADLTGVGEQVVKNRMTRIYSKLGVHGRTKLAIFMKDWVRTDVERLSKLEGV